MLFRKNWYWVPCPRCEATGMVKNTDPRSSQVMMTCPVCRGKMTVKVNNFELEKKEGK